MRKYKRNDAEIEISFVFSYPRTLISRTIWKKVLVVFQTFYEFAFIGRYKFTVNQIDHVCFVPLNNYFNGCDNVNGNKIYCWKNKSVAEENVSWFL